MLVRSLNVSSLYKNGLNVLNTSVLHVID